MESKKAQGLPLNVIIIAIIALLTLTLIVLFATGSIGTLFERTSTFAEITESDIAAAQTKCSTDCIRAQGSRDLEAFKNSAYCGRTVPLDLNADGNITSEELLNCWMDPIFEDCTVEINEVTYNGKDNCL